MSIRSSIGVSANRGGFAGTGLSSSTYRGTTTSSGTLVLIGMNGIDYGNYDGIRVAGGYWLTPEQTLGIEARAFYVEPLSLRLTVAGSSQPSMRLRSILMTSGCSSRSRSSVA